jgi:hypothetical protein
MEKQKNYGEVSKESGLEIKTEALPLYNFERMHRHFNNTEIMVINLRKMAFKYLRTTIVYHNYEQEVKNSFSLRNSCSHSVQVIMPHRILDKNMEIKIYKTTILPVVCMDVKFGLSA